MQYRTLDPGQYDAHKHDYLLSEGQQDDQGAPPIPFFSFADAGIRRAIEHFAADWGDALALEHLYGEAILDPDDTHAEGFSQARLVLVEGSARTDDPKAFERVFADAFEDGYSARIRLYARRGW